MARPAASSLQFLSDVLDSIPAILWTADPSTFVFTWVSRGAETILGFPVERWLESPDFWRERIHPDDRWVIQMYRSPRVAEQGRQLAYRMIAANGRVVWFRDKVHYCSRDGELVELCGVMLDVTAEHEVNEALIRSEENYRRLVHTAPDGIGVHTKGRFVFVNPKFVDIFGASHDSQILGREVLSFVDPAYRDVVQSRQAQVAIGDTVPMTRERLVRIDGTPFDGEVMAIPVVFNGARAVQVVVRDVTERIRLELLAEATNDAIWEGDLETKAFWTNDCFRETFGAPRDFAAARALWNESVHPDDRGRMERMDRSAGHWSEEYRIRKRTGEYIWVHDRGRRMGRRVIGAMLDVTRFR